MRLGDIRRTFGDAVTIVERHAEEFLDGDFHGGIEWRAGGRNNTQLRCAECGESLELRVFEQLVKHSGNAQDDGEAFFFDRRLGGDGIEARSDVERGSADQCPEENNGEADGVRHRQNPVEAIARRERANPGGNPSHEKHVAIGEDDAFGQAGRAGSIDQGADTIFGKFVRADGLGLNIFVKRPNANWA